MTDSCASPVELRIEIRSIRMALLFLLLGLGNLAFGGHLLSAGENVFLALLLIGVGLAFAAVTFLLREQGLFHFDRAAGTLTWERSSWFGVWREGGVVPLDRIKSVRVAGTGGKGGNAATYRCVLELGPGMIALTRGEDGQGSVHKERAARIQAFLDADS